MENAYERMVTFEGNRAAQKLLSEVFEVTDRAWRGIGVIPKSGWRLSEAYRASMPRSAFRLRDSYAGVAALPGGRGAAGAIKPAECAALARSAHRGIRWERRWFRRRGVRGLLQLWAVFVGGGAGEGSGQLSVISGQLLDGREARRSC